MKLKLKNNSVNKIIFGVNDTEKVYGDVIFYDYDGTILYKYTKNEFYELTSMPQLPDRTSENLTCDGWNWTLQEITSRLSTMTSVNVGAIYHTTDGKTHITCNPTEAYPQAKINLTPTVANAVTVDWGDGTTDTWTTTARTTKTHTYTGVTDTSVYDITITCLTGTYLFYTYITGDNTSNSNVVYTEIALSNKVTSLSSNTFNGIYSLKHIVIPNSVTVGSGCFSACYSFQTVTIPSSVTSLGNNCFLNCYSFQTVTIPSSVTTLGSSCFSGCNSLQTVTIPSSVTSLGSRCFSGCYSLHSITIPSGVTSIGSGCFSGCSALQELYMKPTTPPTLASTNAIPSNANLVIYVPSGSLTNYQTASNWSSFASKMVEYI